jgi:hypothetical protein
VKPGTWIEVAGGWPATRCSHCGTFTEGPTWRYYAKPAQWTIALCEACVALHAPAPPSGK